MFTFLRTDALSSLFGLLCLLAFSFVFVGAVLPETAHAQLVVSDLVQCGDDISWSGDGTSGFTYTGECDVCDFQRLLQRILSFLIAIMTAVAALLFANAGVLYVTSPANPSAVSKAHNLFTNTLVGILFVLVAYLLIDFSLKALLPGESGDINSQGPWNTILCPNEADSYYIPPIAVTTIGVDPHELPPLEELPDMSCGDFAGNCVTAVGFCSAGYEVDHRLSDGGACDGQPGNFCCVPRSSQDPCEASFGDGVCYPYALCQEYGGQSEISADCGGTGQAQVCCAVEQRAGGITRDLVNVSEYGLAHTNSAKADRFFAERLKTIESVVGIQVTVTEGCPPSRAHQATCHSTCTCVDIDISPDSPAKIYQMLQVADQQGMRMSWETKSESEYNEVKQMIEGGGSGLTACQTVNSCSGCNLCLFNQWISGSHASVYPK